MKKVAILIDGEWFRIMISDHLRKSLKHGVTADVMYKNACLAINAKEEEILKILYYDCEPHTGNAVNPVSKKTVPCTPAGKLNARQRFFSELGQKPLIALRRGVLRRRNWALTKSYQKKLLQSGQAIPPTENDVILGLTQKGVDMRIGIDVATLALKRQVDRIILISGDLDMIPAMKLARREGVQVGVVQVVGKTLRVELIEDADFVRNISPKS
jgi:uncharacterized LabA/DUF88 family protein